MKMKITSGVRSFQAQGKLYAQGRTEPGKIVTRAKPGMSLHNYGLAADLCFLGDDPYLEKKPATDLHGAGRFSRPWTWFAIEAEAVGLNPGMKWGDAPHVEWGAFVNRLYDMKVHDLMSIEEIWATLDAANKRRLA